MLRDHGLSWNGVTGGFRAFVEYDRENDVTIAFASNLLTGAGGYLRHDVARLLAGETLAPLPRLDVAVVSVPEETLRRYTGIYREARDKEADLHVRNRALWAKEWKLPTSPTTFFCPQTTAGCAWSSPRTDRRPPSSGPGSRVRGSGSARPTSRRLRRRPRSLAVPPPVR